MEVCFVHYDDVQHARVITLTLTCLPINAVILPGLAYPVTPLINSTCSPLPILTLYHISCRKQSVGNEE